MQSTDFAAKHAEFEALAQRYADDGVVRSRTVEKSTKGVEQHVVHSASCCAGGLPGITGPTRWSREEPGGRLKPRSSAVKCGGVLRWPTAYAHGKDGRAA